MITVTGFRVAPSPECTFPDQGGRAPENMGPKGCKGNKSRKLRPRATAVRNLVPTTLDRGQVAFSAAG